MSEYRLPECGQSACRRGLSLVEVVVVLAIIALLSTAAVPVAQVYRQRDKERRLREILRLVRDDGINRYRAKVVQLLMLKRDAGTISADEYAFALATGSVWGHLLPPRVASLYDPVGTLEIAIGPAATTTVTISERLIRSWPDNLPPHPFRSWYPAATWTYELQGTVGVRDIKSRYAGFAIDGSATDEW